MNITIKPPKGCNPNDIKKQVTMDRDIITTVLTYPNGFTVTSVISGKDQVVTPSGELIDLGDGVYQVPN